MKQGGLFGVIVAIALVLGVTLAYPIITVRPGYCAHYPVKVNGVYRAPKLTDIANPFCMDQSFVAYKPNITVFETPMFIICEGLTCSAG